MNFSVHHSTPKDCLVATNQARRELGDSRKNLKPRQLSLWHPIQQPGQKPFLQIASVPLQERVNPKEHRYCLIIQPIGVRACGGQFTSDEAYRIGKATKRWDWSLDAFNRPRCLPDLEALIDDICKQSAANGGEA